MNRNFGGMAVVFAAVESCDVLAGQSATAQGGTRPAWPGGQLCRRLAMPVGGVALAH